MKWLPLTDKFYSNHSIFVFYSLTLGEFLKLKSMPVLKVIEVLANSPTSWEDAAKVAVAEASKTVKNIRSVYVQDQSATVKDGNIENFRVNVKITFEVK